MGCFSSSEDTEILLNVEDTHRSYHEDLDNVLSEHPDDSGSDSGSEPDDPDVTCNVGGYVMAVLTVLGNVTGFACTQALNQTVPHSELNGLRSLSQFVLTAPVLAVVNKCDVRVKTKRIDYIWVALAAACSTSTNYAFYGAAYYLPLGVALGIIESLILALNYVVASVIRRKVRWCELLITVVCLVGVVMVIQPQALFTDSTTPHLNGTDVNTNHSNYHRPMCYRPSPISIMSNDSSSPKPEARNREREIGYIFCVGGAVIYAFYMQLVNRKLSEINMFIFSFWSCAFGTASSFLIMAFSESPYFPTSSVCIAILFTHIIAAGLASIMNYRVYQLLNPVIASLIRTLRLPICFVLQYTALSALFPGKQNSVAIVGAVMVFLGNALIPVYTLVQDKCRKCVTSHDVI